MVTDFVFDGQTLSGFGYMIASFNGANDETAEVSMLDFTDISSPLSDVSNKVATSYPNNYTATIQIMKSPDCNGNEDDDYHLTYDDISTISKWLCRKEYKWFKWIDDDDDDDAYFEVHCKVGKVITAGTCYGLELTFESNRPFAVSSEKVTTTTLSNANGSFTVEMYSDEEGWIYPDIELTLAQGGTLNVSNSQEAGRVSTIKNCTSGEKITFHGDVLQASSTVVSHVLATDYNYVFPRLYNEYGSYTNVITVNLPCSVTLKYRGIRKVGLGI